jgi:hypothetical protein
MVLLSKQISMNGQEQWDGPIALPSPCSLHSPQLSQKPLAGQQGFLLLPDTGLVVSTSFLDLSENSRLLDLLLKPP